MGLDLLSIRYHCMLKRCGASFEKVAMLGRQNFSSEVNATTLMRAVDRAGLHLDQSKAVEILTTSDGYGEAFYRWLGAKTIDSFDRSSYEGANQIWDMNKPLPDRARDEYDFVFDGGTLEHVFQYPAALKGAMSMVRLGGLFLSITPANSYLGHGFYQFSPDLPFTVLTENNGFSYEGVYVAEMRHSGRIFAVVPPGRQRGRALASTPWPAVLAFHGKRCGPIPEIITANQPDYEDAWDSGTHQERSTIYPPRLLGQGDMLIPETRRRDILRTLKLLRVLLTRNAFFDHNIFREVKDF